MALSRRALLTPLAALPGAACSPVALLNATAPSNGVLTTADLAYAPGPRHGVDVYAPVGAQRAPVLVFFYGGGWRSGDRAIYRFLGATLAAAGVVCMVPDYRLWPEVRSPGFVEDAAQAVAWARAQAATHGGDPAQLFLMGHSAGAQIAALLALNPAFLGAVGLDPGRDLRGMIGLAGPYDFLPLRSARLRAIFGPEASWPESQPINYASAAAPPMLLATGDADSTVLPANTEQLTARLRAAGAAVESVVYPGIGHVPIIGAFAGPLGFVAPVRQDVLRFIAARRVG